MKNLKAFLHGRGFTYLVRAVGFLYILLIPFNPAIPHDQTVIYRLVLAFSTALAAFCITFRVVNWKNASFPQRCYYVAILLFIVLVLVIH